MAGLSGAAGFDFGDCSFFSLPLAEKADIIGSSHCDRRCGRTYGDLHRRKKQEKTV